MRCQHCNKNEATTFLRKTVNGVTEEMHLCSECAKELGVMDEFRMPSMEEMFGDTFLGNFLGAGAAAMNALTGVDRCTSCGSSFNDIVQSGRIGCADCYEKFEDRLDPSIRKIHGKTKHVGKFVSYSEVDGQDSTDKEQEKPQKTELESLKEQMKKAIDEQRFEDAAVIRDKIKAIEEGKNE